MATSTKGALQKAIAANTFEPAYLLSGEEEYEKESALRRMIAAAVEPTTRDFNLDQLRGGDVQPEQLDSILSTPPLMAQRRVVVIRSVGALKKHARSALDQYLARPASDLLVILVADAGGTKSDKISIDRAVNVDFAPIAESRVPEWITQKAAQLGARITSDAATLLLAAIGPDLSRLATELEKLVSYSGADVIDDAAVGAIVGVERGRTLTDLLDRVAARDAVGAVALIDPVLAGPKSNGVVVIMALTTQMLALTWARAMRDRGTSAGALSGALFEFLKESRANAWRPWGDATRAWAKAVDHWSARDLDRAMDALLQADMTLKETKVSSEEQILATAIFAVCGAEAIS